MSDVTKAALEDAISAHIADECDGDMAGAYALVVETTTLEEYDLGASAFHLTSRDTQSPFTTDGLLHSALHMKNFSKEDEE